MIRVVTAWVARARRARDARGRVDAAWVLTRAREL